jgi:hypothetical protein
MIDDKLCGIGFLLDVGEGSQRCKCTQLRPSKSMQVVCKCVPNLKYSGFLCDLFADLLECAVYFNLGCSLMRLRDFSSIYAIYAFMRFMMQFVYVFKVLGLGVCFFCYYCRVLINRWDKLRRCLVCV